MAKYDGLLGQPILEVEEPDKEGGLTLIFKDNRFLFVKIEDGKLNTISCLLYTSPSPRDYAASRMPSSA